MIRARMLLCMLGAALLGCARGKPIPVPAGIVLSSTQAQSACQRWHRAPAFHRGLSALGRLTVKQSDSRTVSRILLRVESNDAMRIDLLAPNAFVILRSFFVSAEGAQERTAGGDVVEEWENVTDFLSKILGMPVRFIELIDVVSGELPEQFLQCEAISMQQLASPGEFLVRLGTRMWGRVTEAGAPVELTWLDPYRQQVRLHCLFRRSVKEALTGVSCDVPKRGVTFDIDFQKIQRDIYLARITHE